MTDIPNGATSVLDKGYVRLLDHMGDDLAVVNAARVSFDKQSDWHYDFTPDSEFTVERMDHYLKPKDRKLLHYLLQHGHTSPLRHCTLSFEVYAPLMVMRQWGKYRVGSTWSFEDSDDPIETINESSRRYVTEEPEFYIPEVWRSAPEHKKQGSGETLPYERSGWLTPEVEKITKYCLNQYEWALREGVCVEQARLFLPAYAMYVRARWTVSLQGLIHFIGQRDHPDAQVEIQEYARAVKQLAEPLFPETFEEVFGG